MLHLLRADFYRLIKCRWAIFLVCANISAVLVALVLCAASVRYGGNRSGSAVEAAVLLAAAPCSLNAVLFCPIVSCRSFAAARIKISLGYTRRQVYFSNFLASSLCLAGLYCISFALCCSLFPLFGFETGGAVSLLCLFPCGLALYLAYAAACTGISFAAGKRSLAFALCALFLIGEAYLNNFFIRLDAFMIEMGIGVPFSKLAMVFFTLLFPRGVLEMLVAGGSAYPLYIFLSCLFTALCAAVGNVSFRRKQLR